MKSSLCSRTATIDGPGRRRHGFEGNHRAAVAAPVSCSAWGWGPSEVKPPSSRRAQPSSPVVGNRGAAGDRDSVEVGELASLRSIRPGSVVIWSRPPGDVLLRSLSRWCSSIGDGRDVGRDERVDALLDERHPRGVSRQTDRRPVGGADTHGVFPSTVRWNLSDCWLRKGPRCGVHRSGRRRALRGTRVRMAQSSRSRTGRRSSADRRTANCVTNSPSRTRSDGSGDDGMTR